jgi:shikimate kinase/3-dehydroquinate synthase
MARPQRIVLIGLPGTGKSRIARLVARRLRWSSGDTDDEIVSADGREIPQIFRDEGEPFFRSLERQAVSRLVSGERRVIATGGGAVLDPINREHLWRGSFVVHLDAHNESILGRINPSDPRRATTRPLLSGEDPAARLENLRAARAPLYALADWTVRTDGLTLDQVADEIVGAWERVSDAVVGGRGPHPPNPFPARTGPAAPNAGRGGAQSTTVERVSPLPALGEGPGVGAVSPLAAHVTTPGGSYPAYAGWGILDGLPRWLRAVGVRSVIHVVADAAVADLHGETLLGALRAGGYEPVLHALQLSEGRKTLAAAEEVYDRLVERRAERSHALLAFGGGVATDLGGFVAATYLRGMPLVQVPTSLLGMVDAAIGGKVAVNHREGKNLIGAFYQPVLVVADAALLPTLPRREFVSGWAEVIKHGLIMDLELLDWLERDADVLLALEPEPSARVLQRSIALKAQVVSTDEREAGPRMTLNYGHTTGHALEAATGYEALLHGEAVAVGMVAAAHIGRRLDLLTADDEARQNRLIARFGLPLRAPGIDVNVVLGAMSLDKKVSGKQLRWVLLNGLGRTVIRDDVPVELVREAVELVLSP